jgi:hypothetical protein
MTRRTRFDEAVGSTLNKRCCISFLQELLCKSVRDGNNNACRLVVCLGSDDIIDSNAKHFDGVTNHLFFDLRT